MRTITDESVEHIADKYKEIINLINKYPGSKVTILETPIYSIQRWNKLKGHKDPSVFEEQDERLAEQIYTLNSRVRDLNNNTKVHSPEFSSDISTSTKYRCGKDRNLKTKKYYNFNLYKDGIHPDTLLAKAWLKKISEQAKRDCWENTAQQPDQKQ